MLDAPNFQYLEGQADTASKRGNKALAVDESGNYVVIPIVSGGVVAAPGTGGSQFTSGNAANSADLGNRAYGVNESGNYQVISLVSGGVVAAPGTGGSQFTSGNAANSADLGNRAYGVNESGNYQVISLVSGGVVTAPVAAPYVPHLLGAKLYDPAVAVTKTLTTRNAMAALDTTNLRIAFTVPTSGAVRVKVQIPMSKSIGSATPAVLLGVMSGATVIARSLGTITATTDGNQYQRLWVDFVVPGLTPGAAVTWDAAYSVKSTVATGDLSYGGPDDTTSVSAFGSAGFEVWSA